MPIVGENGHWMRWDIGTSAWVDTGITVATSLVDGSVTTPKLADGSVTWPKLATEARHSNPNLLDNWYFVGGGSQQGGGRFPINQRGLTTYTVSEYAIDRWIVHGNHTISLTPDGLLLPTTGLSFYQVIERSRLGGSTVATLSVLTDKDCDIWLNFGTVSGLTTGKMHVISGVDTSTDEIIRGCFFNTSQEIPENTHLIAAKLELGPHQTLAHQDADGNWVLNDPPPKYGEELAKCQRYQTDLNIFHSGYARFGLGYAYAETLAYVQIPLPTTIRAFPTVEMSGNIGLVDLAAHTVLIPAISIVSDEIAANIANVRVTVAGGLTPGKIYALQVMGDASARLIFNSNL